MNFEKFERDQIEYKTTKSGVPQVSWENDQQNDTFTLIFPYPTEQVTGQATEQVTEQAEIRDRTAKILKYCETPKSRHEIMRFLNLSHREYFISEILKPLLKQELLKMTIPEKPNSPKQRYYTVKKQMKEYLKELNLEK
ncbi:hypothetical protein KAU33_01940 [Candidatus Dependentiae bacterium]|nr:hypothetical protein [Candidatus Dependentiae bacterium]